MDRRRLKSRSTGLHRGLQSSGESARSTRLEDATTSGTSSGGNVGTSQKLSNSEMLRRKIFSPPNLPENNENSSRNEVTSPNEIEKRTSSGRKKNSRLCLSDSDENDDDDDDGGNVTMVEKICIEKSRVSSKRVESDLESEKRKSPGFGGRNPDVGKLLGTRKRLLARRLDSEEEMAEPSPSKIRRTDISDKFGGRDPKGSSTASQAPGTSDSPRVADRIRLGSPSRALQSGRSGVSRRIAASQRESNSSRLKKLASPVKPADQHRVMEMEDEIVSPRKNKKVDALHEFMEKSGIRVSTGDGPYELDEDPPTIEKNMIRLLSSGKFKKEEIINLWQVHVNDEDNLKKALSNVSMSKVKHASSATCMVSLVRIFLQIPALQTAISNHLLQKLNEAVLIADTLDDVPWGLLLLQQFRFLETVVEADSLTARLEELLESCPVWFQREMISFLSDIIVDNQHHAIADMLAKLMESNADLTNVILDCITNLSLGKDYLEELREKVLIMMKNNLDIGRTPAMVKFVLSECPTVAVCQKTLTSLRKLQLQPLNGENSDEYFTSQTFVTTALKMSILLSKNMSAAAIAVIKQTNEPPTPIDLIMLLLLYSDTPKKKNAEMVMKQHVKSGFYRASLLGSFYQDYREVAKNMQPEALQLASSLIKSEDSAYTDFAIDWFRYQFVSQSDAIHKQREIIEKIVLLMGITDYTARTALGILRRLTEDEKEKKLLQSHCNHLRILLDKIDNFDLQEVATLSDLLFALCTSSTSSSAGLQDDLFILLQKQIASPKTLRKCKGVLAAAMAIKHLAGSSESCKIAQEMFAKVERGSQYCPQSRALFYDQIGRVIAETKNMEADFLKDITEKFQDEFVNIYMTDLNDYEGELVSNYGLVDVENEPQKCVMNFGDGKNGAVAPAFFRLLRICFMRLNDGDLSDINLLLGVPVLMPKEIDFPDSRSLDIMICTINWFREIISGFVNQPDPILQEQILKRLENLMTLQVEFSNALTLGEPRYQPPAFYFHRYPVPGFVKVEKKMLKKGKGSSMDKTKLSEWEAWEIGSTLCAKNPMYFRQMDAKIVDLLDLRMDEQLTQSPKNISIAQVCFLIKELLAMFVGSEASETLIRDLVHLMPKICSKLQDIVARLRERDDAKNRKAVNLILTLLTTIFEWKGFKSAIYHSLLRDGLRTLAGQLDKSNSMLRSSKELVAESYKYFESLSDICTEISLAFSLVKICRTLMNHSETFSRQSKDKQALMACGFLSLEWPNDKPTGAGYKAAVVGLLANWMQNEPNPLDTVTAVMGWLPDESATLKKPQDRLERLPAITKSIFHHMFHRLFEGLVNGTKISIAEANSDPQRIEVWQQVGNNVKHIVEICKNSSRAVLFPFLRNMTSLLKLFMSSGMPIMEHNLRYQTEEVKEILKMIQGGTRYLNMVCVDSAEKKDMTLAKLVPVAKQVTEKLLYLVKAMLVLNNSSDAFWMGNLVNKNLQGQQILSQTSSDDVTATSAEGSALEDVTDDVMSDILQSNDEDGASDDE